MHVFSGKDVRLSILHYTQWSADSSRPIISKNPCSSLFQRQEVVQRCKKASGCSVAKKKNTRLSKECATCVTLQATLATKNHELKNVIASHQTELQNEKNKLHKEITRLQKKVKLLQYELEQERLAAVRARSDRHGDVNRCVFAAVLSGIQFWQFKRFFQITGTLGSCEHKKWDGLVVKLYAGVKSVVQWSTSTTRMVTRECGRRCSADTRWSHVGAHAKHCTAVVVDVDLDVIVGRINLSKQVNRYDLEMDAWGESSGAMEGKALEEIFRMLKKTGYRIDFCSFDGDSEARKAFFSFYPFGTPTRDPSHQGKNSYKMLKRVLGLFKYNCNCEYLRSAKTGLRKKDASGKFLRAHNYMT